MTDNPAMDLLLNLPQEMLKARQAPKIEHCNGSISLFDGIVLLDSVPIKWCPICGQVVRVPHTCQKGESRENQK